jgi:subtilase family serine protease
VKAPAAAAPGAAISVRDVTRNAGPGDADATTTRIWLSTDKSLGAGDLELGTRSIPALAAGATNAGTSVVTLPAVAPGGYFLLVQADADADAPESDEADNLETKAIVLGPDLTIKSMVFAPASPTSSAPTTITLTVKNAGGGAAGASVTRLYRSANGKLDGSDTLLAEAPLGVLAAGVSVGQSVTVTLPAGTYYVLAICDVANAVPEAKETNNLKKAQKTIP